MATDEPTAVVLPIKDAVATADCVTVAPTESGDRITLTMTLSIEFEVPVALDLAMRLIGAAARARGLGR
jgi:hypothetical protein